MAILSALFSKARCCSADYGYEMRRAAGPRENAWKLEPNKSKYSLAKLAQLMPTLVFMSTSLCG